MAGIPWNINTTGFTMLLCYLLQALIAKNMSYFCSSRNSCLFHVSYM
jgi:hypothetical protein